VCESFTATTPIGGGGGAMGPPIVLGPDATIRITVWAKALAAATGVYLASRNRDTWDYMLKETQNYLTHIHLTNPSQNPDPDGRNRRKKQLQNKLDKMRSRVKRLNDSMQQRAEVLLEELGNLMDDGDE
jgi:hypothetical protein